MNKMGMMGGMGSAQTQDIEDKISALKDKVAVMLAQKKFDWTYPSEVELATCRDQYRNKYGYSVDFITEYDLFGENRYFGVDKKTQKQGSSAGYTGDGQLNITTEVTRKNTSEIMPLDEDLGATLLAKE